MKYLPKLNWFLNNGIYTDHFGLDITLRRVYNVLLLVVLGIMSIVFVEDIISQDFVGLIVISTFLSFSIGLFLLVRFGYFELSTFIFNLGFGVGVFALSVMYINTQHLAMCYIFLMISTIILTFNRIALGLLLLIQISLFLVSVYYANQFEPLLDRSLDGISNMSISISITLAIVSLTTILIKEIYSNEEQINDLVNSLKKQNKTLSQTNEELEKLTYLASHDLKAPLRTIISFLGLAEQKIDSEDKDSLRRYLKIAKEGAGQLNQLIKDTMDYSLVDKEKGEQSEMVNLNHILDHIKKGLDPNQSNVSIHYEELRTIKSNKILLLKLFQNIIDNGIKYNESSQKVVKIENERRDNHYVLRITDNGIGIDEKYHTEIFKMYQRLHGQNEYEGNGLGLAICQKICSQLNGSLRLESALGQGSTFIISLPA